jgi:hypothetical protein
MHASKIAKLTHVDLKNCRSRTTKQDRVFAQLLRETVHRARLFFIGWIEFAHHEQRFKRPTQP